MFLCFLVAWLFYFFSTGTTYIFLHRIQNVYVHEGRNVSLKFRLINKPEDYGSFTLSNTSNVDIATVYYFFPERDYQIRTSERFLYTGNLTARLFSYMLIKAKTTDAGVYRSTYSYTGDISNLTLYIFQPLPKPVITQRIAIVGKDVNLTCNTASLTLPAPGLAISYSWKMNGTIIKNNANYTLHGTDNNQLTINKIGRNSKFDQYICEAKEENGQTENSGIAIIDTKYGPDKTTILSTATTYVYEYHNTTTVTCIADCNPKCTYTWWRESVNIQNGSSFQLLHVQRSQEGKYRCIAENYVNDQRMRGYAQLMIYVRITTPGELGITDVKYITCNADCNPQCTFSWWKGSARIHTGPVFQLFNVQRNQEGKYRCKAENSVGNQTLTGSADLMVYVKSDTVIFSAVGTSVGTFLLMLLFMVLILITLRRNGICKRDGKKATRRQEYKPDNVLYENEKVFNISVMEKQDNETTYEDVSGENTAGNRNESSTRRMYEVLSIETRSQVTDYEAIDTRNSENNKEDQGTEHVYDNTIIAAK